MQTGACDQESKRWLLQVRGTGAVLLISTILAPTASHAGSKEDATRVCEEIAKRFALTVEKAHKAGRCVDHP